MIDMNDLSGMLGAGKEKEVSSDVVPKDSSTELNDLRQGPGDGSDVPKRRVGVVPSASRRKSGFGFGMYKGVPRVLISSISSMFPDASNQTDALVAYMMCFGDRELRDDLKPCLTAEQADLVKNFKDSDATIDKKLTQMNKKLDQMQRVVDAVHMAAMYDLMDRKMIDDSVKAANFDYFSDVVDPVNGQRNLIVDMIQRSDAAVTKMRMARDSANGREISKNVGNKSIQR